MNISFNCTKFLNDTSCLDPPWVKYAGGLKTWVYANMTLCVFGATMNALLCVAILSDRRLRKGSGGQIAHLVAVETFICAAAMAPDTIMTYFVRSQIIDSSICPFLDLIRLVAMHAGLWAAMFLAFTRFMAIALPLSYRKINTRGFTVSWIVASWTIGFATVLPNIWHLGARFERIPPWNNCGNNVVNPALWTITLTTGQYLPGGITTVIYFVILAKTTLHPPHRRQPRRGLADRPNHPNAAAISLARARSRLATVRVLAASSVFYWVCFLPNRTIVAYYPWVAHQSPVLMLWTRTINWCAYVFNPVSQLHISCVPFLVLRPLNNSCESPYSHML